MKNEIFCCVAGIKMKFSCAEPLYFKEESDKNVMNNHFRGFETTPLKKLDYNFAVEYFDKKKKEKFPIKHKFTNEHNFVAENEDSSEWKLEISRTGDERVSASFFLPQTPSLLTGATIKYSPDGQGVVTLQKAKEDEAISAYVFPIFNIALSRMLLCRNGFLVHSSVVDDGGKGYLFTAVSGTGKSTMAKIWESCGATIINDDMNAIIPSKRKGYEAHNIPMPYYLSVPKHTKLRGIFLIKQSKENYIQEIPSPMSTLSFVTNTIAQYINTETIGAHMKNVASVCVEVPVYELGFKPDTEIVEMVRKMKL